MSSGQKEVLLCKVIFASYAWYVFQPLNLKNKWILINMIICLFSLLRIHPFYCPVTFRLEIWRNNLEFKIKCSTSFDRYQSFAINRIFLNFLTQIFKSKWNISVSIPCFGVRVFEGQKWKYGCTIMGSRQKCRTFFTDFTSLVSMNVLSYQPRNWKQYWCFFQFGPFEFENLPWKHWKFLMLKHRTNSCELTCTLLFTIFLLSDWWEFSFTGIMFSWPRIGFFGNHCN